MRSNYLKATLKAAILAVTVLLLTACASFAQTVSLTAGATSITLPDGQVVPMWGYTCIGSGASIMSITPGAPGSGYSNPAITLTGGGGTGATASATADPTTGAITSITLLTGGSNYTSAPIVNINSTTVPTALASATVALSSPASCAPLNANAGIGWSPVVITVPPGNVTINLTNNLPTPPGATAGIPTSLMIVGQLGVGLGTTATTTPSPVHPTQNATWPIAGDSTGPQFTPPPQGPRVQSFANEVTTGVTTALVWNGLKPGTYLIESGTHPSIQGPMGLYGALVVTTAPAGTVAGTAYPTTPPVTYNADVPLLLSEIDAVQNNAVNRAVGTSGFTETAVWSGQPGKCGNPPTATAPNSTFGTCYPPAVNYDPRYYLVNGVAFDRTGTNANRSLFAATPANATGTVLVRFVNAGLRMHVPSIVGAQTGSPAVSGFSLIAEDGNVLPGKPRVQSEVFLAAGKTYDVLINAPVAAAPATAPSALPVFDRQLSLSNNNQRDGGMQAYIGVNGATLTTSGAGSIGLTAAAKPDSYFLVPGNALTVSDPAKGVIANDIGVYGVQLLSGPTSPCTPSSALPCVTLNPDGTFVYVPAAGATAGSFTYCANGTVTGSVCSTGSTLTATVTLAACTAGSGCLGEPPVANADSYTSNIASRLQISPPGVLANDTDPQGHPLCSAPIAVTGCPTTGQTFTATGGTERPSPRLRCAEFYGGDRGGPNYRLPLDHRGRPHVPN